MPLLLLVFWALPLMASGLFDERTDLRRASQEEIEAAMRLEWQQGYDFFATSNGARLLTGVILQLVEWHDAQDAAPSPILVDHRDYFAAFLAVTETRAENAPQFLRVAYEYGEDQMFDYRRDQVIRKVVKGPKPRVAINVLAGWKDGQSSYSCEDTHNQPHLQVTHRRNNSYRLLDFGDIQMFDEIRGVTGRATSGLLGLLFDVLGEAQALRSLSAISVDGIQITRTTARKGVELTATASVYPDGRAENGLPPGRPDLIAIEERLRQPVEIDYYPMPGAE